jgi:hypothetical protein
MLIQSKHWKFLHFKKQSITSVLLRLILLLLSLFFSYACVIIEIVLSIVLINLLKFLKLKQLFLFAIL